MKIITIFVLALASTSHLVYAQDISDTYDSNTTLTVKLMNNIKDAVKSKQDKTSSVNGQGCHAQEAIQSITTDGGVKCIDIPVQNNGTIPLTGAVSVHGAQFNLTDGSAVSHKLRVNGLTNTGGSSTTGNGSTDVVEALANISLPDGVTVNSMVCSVTNKSTTAFTAKLRGVKFDRLNPKQEIFETNSAHTTTDNSIQVITDTTTHNGLIDNRETYYAIFMDLPKNATIHGCSVRY